MRRHNAFPRPGDRIRLAIPLPTDTEEPHARYGTVLERSCGRSNALRIRWDREGAAALAVDGGAEAWLADAGWYWDKAHLEVVDAHDHAAPAPAHHAPATEEETWLSATPAGSPTGAVNGSLDAVAEWEAALASEIGGGADDGWEELLANALGNGAPAVAQPRVASPARPAPAPSPAPVAAPPPDATPVEQRQAPQPAGHHNDIRRRTPSDTRVVGEEPEPEQAPAAAPVQGWKGDDILPTRRTGGKRWGRR